MSLEFTEFQARRRGDRRVVIPGFCKRDSSRILYFSVPEEVTPRKQFENIKRYTNPRIARRGMAIEVAWCRIALPDGTTFHALEYWGDLSGWKKQLEAGAQAHHALLAEIEGDNFVINDGRVFRLFITRDGRVIRLNECKVYLLRHSR